MIIIKIGQEFTPDEVKAIKGEIKLSSQYCNKCQLKLKKCKGLSFKN